MSPRLGLSQRKQGSRSPKALGHGLRYQNGVALSPVWPAAPTSGLSLSHPPRPRPEAWQLLLSLGQLPTQPLPHS